MVKVTQEEILDVLSDAWECPESAKQLAERIQDHGIAPPDGLVLVPKALQAKPEPVAYIPQAALEAFVEGTVSGVRVWRTKDESVGDVPLYTTPPSVDALIAEIESCRWEDGYDAHSIKAALDKYRNIP